MTKSISFLLIVLLLMTGCQTETSKDINEDNESNYTSTEITVDECIDSNGTAIIDTNGCLFDDIAWRNVSDVWATTEGKFSDDMTFWVRSLMAVGDSNVTLFYRYAGDYRETDYQSYLSLGYYYISREIKFDLQLNMNYLGAAPYFYVNVRGKCYRGILPDSLLLPPCKKLVEVTNP